MPNIRIKKNISNTSFLEEIESAELSADNITATTIITTYVETPEINIPQNTTIADPAIYFRTGTDASIYSGIPNRIDIGLNSINEMSIDSTALTLPTNHIVQTTGNISTNTVKSAVGTELLPSLSFTNDLDTGIYNVSADVLGIVSGGIKQMSVAVNSVVVQAGNLTVQGPTTNTVITGGKVSGTNLYVGGNDTSEITTFTNGLNIDTQSLLISGANTNVYTAKIGQATYNHTGGGSSANTNGYSLYIDGPPIAGTSTTITNKYALCVNSGITKFNDTTNTFSPTEGSIQCAGGLYVAKFINAPNQSHYVAIHTGSQTSALATSTNWGTVNSDNSVGISILSQDANESIQYNNNGTYTILFNGMYAISTYFLVVGTAMTSIEAMISVDNSTTDYVARIYDTVGSNIDLCYHLSGYRYLSVGDVISLKYRITHSTLTSIALNNVQLAIVRLF